MPVVIALAAIVILGGVVVVAMGRGGELARAPRDTPVPGDFRSWADVADFRPPPALLGYHARATEQALSMIARTIAERDAEIDWLRSRLAELAPDSPDADSGGADSLDPESLEPESLEPDSLEPDSRTSGSAARNSAAPDSVTTNSAAPGRRGEDR